MPGQYDNALHSHAYKQQQHIPISLFLRQPGHIGGSQLDIPGPDRCYRQGNRKRKPAEIILPADRHRRITCSQLEPAFAQRINPFVGITCHQLWLVVGIRNFQRINHFVVAMRIAQPPSDTHASGFYVNLPMNG